MARRIGIGDRVTWDWTAQRRDIAGRSHRERGTVEGIVFELNPRISPSSKYGVRDDRGETYYPHPDVRVRRVERRSR